MLNIFTVFSFLLISGLQACNPGQNATSLETIKNASHSHPVTPVMPNSVESVISNVLNVTATRFPEEYTSNCHNHEGSTTTSHGYQHIIVTGLPFQRGVTYGRLTRDKILRSIEFYKVSPLMPIWIDCVNFVKTNYLEALEYYYPNGLEEMKGIAEGAGVQLEDILILNSRYELIRWKNSERTKQFANYPENEKAKYSSELPECNRQIVVNSTAKINATVPEDAELSTSSTNLPDNEIESTTEGEMDECTGAVALSTSTKYAHVLLGQNWDTHEFIWKNDTAILLEVHPDPCENIKPFVILTEAGQVGGIGMNEDGVGVLAMSLKSSSDTYQRLSGKGWIPSILLRRILLESPNFSLGLREILRAPVHISINMMIATAEDEAVNIELTPNSYFTSLVPLEKEIFVHSNHFKSLSFVSRNDIKEKSHGSSSIFRDRRVERHLLNAWPRISEETFQTAFTDHVGYPKSVCAHSLSDKISATTSRKATVASIIFNLSQRTLQLAKGPPCIEAYKNYCFTFSQL